MLAIADRIMTERKSTTGGLTLKSSAGTESTGGSIEAVFVTFGVRDHDGDVVEPGAIAAGPVILSSWNHESHKAALPVGKGRIVIVGNTARFVGSVFDTQAGHDTFTVLKGLGELAEFSWSLDKIVGRYGRDSAGNQARFISSVAIREVSPVLRAASIGTCLVDAKLDEATRLEIEQIAKRYMRRPLPPKEALELEYIRFRQITSRRGAK